MGNIVETARRLSEASIKRMDKAFSRVVYEEELDNNFWQMPEEYISIYYEPEYWELSNEKKKRLSLLEMVNFFSINIHGEQSLISEFEKRLYRGRTDCEGFDASRYMQHFIHEENAHTFMLAEYCYRYYGKVMKVKTIEIERMDISYDAAELLVYGRTQLLENFLVYMNKLISSNDDCGSTARHCNRVHMLDEVRHIAWDEAAIKYYMDRLLSSNHQNDMEVIVSALYDYRETAFRMLYNPKVYNELGISDPIGLARRARQNPKRLKVVEEWFDSTGKTLKTINS